MHVLDMKIHKEIMFKQLERSRGYLDEVEALVEALPDELPEGVSLHAGNWAVYLDIPYDWEMYRQVRRCLEEWVVTAVLNDEGQGDKFYVLHPPGGDKYDYAKLYITLKPSMNQSKCRVEVVGKREVDIVKVVCDD